MAMVIREAVTAVLCATDDLALRHATFVPGTETELLRKFE